jgi:hypothetical protein
MELQDAELKALQEGTSLERFDVALDAAQSRKDKIKQEYLLHVQVRAGCYHTGGPDGTIRTSAPFWCLKRPVFGGSSVSREESSCGFVHRSRAGPRNAPIC